MRSRKGCPGPCIRAQSSPATASCSQSPDQGGVRQTPLSRWQEAALQPTGGDAGGERDKLDRGTLGPTSALLTLGGGQSRDGRATDRRAYPQSSPERSRDRGERCLLRPACLHPGRPGPVLDSQPLLKMFSRAGVRKEPESPAEGPRTVPAPLSWRPGCTQSPSASLPALKCIISTASRPAGG